MTHTFIDQAVRILREHGLDVDVGSLDTSGKFGRCPIIGRDKQDDAGSYLVFMDENPTILWWDFSGRIDPGQWTQDGKPVALTAAQKKKIEAHLAKRDAEAAEVSKNAFHMHVYASKDDVQEHGYAKLKGVDFGPNVRRFGAGTKADYLLVPAYDKTGDIRTLQEISDGNRFGDGTRNKTFLKGGRKSGCFCPVGATFREIRNASKVLIGEGLATVAAGVQATGLPGVVAFDAGNLLAVSKVVRELAAPGADIIILGDDDQKPDTDKNPGIEAATKAAQAIGGRVVLPDMGKKADFWDVFNELGADAVKERIEVEPADACLDSIFNGAALMDMVLPEVEWAVPDLLPQGLCILGGPPKLGKSWFIYSLCIGLGAGGRVLGNFPTERGRALYLALEDSKRRLKDRLEHLQLVDPFLRDGLANVDICTEWPRFDDEGGLEKLETYIKRNVSTGLRLVAIDTWAKVLPKSKARGNNAYENDSIIMGRVKTLADRYGVCILLVTHLSKARQGGDPFDSITGSQGQFGTADTALLLARKRGEQTARLITTGRDIEGNTYELAWQTPAGWRCTGIETEKQRAMKELTPERQQIIDIIRKNGAPMKPDAIAKALGKASVRNQITKLLEEGFLVKAGYGMYACDGDSEYSDDSGDSEYSDDSRPGAGEVSSLSSVGKGSGDSSNVGMAGVKVELSSVSSVSSVSRQKPKSAFPPKYAKKRDDCPGYPDCARCIQLGANGCQVLPE